MAGIPVALSVLRVLLSRASSASRLLHDLWASLGERRHAANSLELQRLAPRCVTMGSEWTTNRRRDFAGAARTYAFRLLTACGDVPLAAGAKNVLRI